MEIYKGELKLGDIVRVKSEKNILSDLPAHYKNDKIDEYDLVVTKVIYRVSDRNKINQIEAKFADGSNPDKTYNLYANEIDIVTSENSVIKLK